MKHKNFPYAISTDYKSIYEFLNNNANFFLIGFNKDLPNHMFKMRKTIHTGEIVIVDSLNFLKHVESAEEFEKVCKEMSLYIIEPEKVLK